MILCKFHAKMEQRWYSLEMMLSVTNHVAEEVLSSRCSCTAAMNLGIHRFCKHIVASIYSLGMVADGDKIPEWN